MSPDILQILRQTSAGDQSAQQTLLALFKEQKIPQPEQEQIHIFLKSAAKESHHAIYMRGLLYDAGYGIKQDSEMAFLLMREAAAKGNSLAIYEVGHRFLEGRGVNQNYVSALQWLKTAAESPHYVSAAMLDLGRMYEQGHGVEVDLERAKYWYNLGRRE